MKSWESHSVVVTGGNGFLGSAAVAKLQAKGYKTGVSFPRDSTAFEEHI